MVCLCPHVRIRWLSALPLQGTGKAAPVLSGACGLWKLEQVKYHKVPGVLSGDHVGQAVFRGSCCQSSANFYWLWANVCVLVLTLLDFHGLSFFFFFLSSRGHLWILWQCTKHGNARSSKNKSLALKFFSSLSLLIHLNDVSEAGTSLWYNLRHFLQELEYIWLSHYFKWGTTQHLLWWDP